jgi:hypothetical protein
MKMKFFSGRKKSTISEEETFSETETFLCRKKVAAVGGWTKWEF